MLFPICKWHLWKLQVLRNHSAPHSPKRLRRRPRNRLQAPRRNRHQSLRLNPRQNRGRNSRKATGRSSIQPRKRFLWCPTVPRLASITELSRKIPYDPTWTDEGFSACCPCGDGRLCNHLWGPRLYRVSLDRSISASRGSRQVPAASRMDFCSAPCHNDFRRHRYHRFSSRSPVVHLRMFSLPAMQSSIAAS